MTPCPSQALASTYIAHRLPDLRYRRILCLTLLMISPWASSCPQSNITNTITQQPHLRGRFLLIHRVWFRRQFQGHHACGMKYGVPNRTQTCPKNLHAQDERDQIACDPRLVWRTGGNNLQGPQQNMIWTSHFQTAGELRPAQSTMIGIP
jgi:hypothetical protein